MARHLTLPELERVELPPDAVEIGRIQDAWGIRGELKVLPYSESPETLLSVRGWFVQRHKRSRRTFQSPTLLHVGEVREHGGAIVARVDEVPDRTTAEALRGASIFVPRSSFPRLSEDEYYWVDLIGLTVVNRQNEPLGSVQDLISTGPQQVLVIGYEELGKPHTRLIPFVSAYVDTVDLSARRITVDWPGDY
jgi:16S rRNA processing protein RimM